MKRLHLLHLHIAISWIAGALASASASAQNKLVNKKTGWLLNDTGRNKVGYKKIKE